MPNQILVRTKATLAISLTAAAAGDLTAIVTDDAGVEVANGVATQDAQELTRYTFEISPRTELGVLRVDWSGTWDNVSQVLTTWAEVVGSRLFAIAELRAAYPEIDDTYSDAVIAAYRDRITDYFRDRAGVSFTRRRKRVVVPATGARALAVEDHLVQRVVAAAVDGQAWTTEQLAAVLVPTLGVRLVAGPGAARLWWGSGAVDVTYEYGMDEPPAQIRRAAMILARRELATQDVDDRAVTLSNDLGTVRLSVPGPDYPTGIPIVDQALRDYGHEIVIA